jgi:hypothetical protein
VAANSVFDIQDCLAVIHNMNTASSCCYQFQLWMFEYYRNLLIGKQQEALNILRTRLAFLCQSANEFRQLKEAVYALIQPMDSSSLKGKQGRVCMISLSLILPELPVISLVISLHQMKTK